MGGSPNCALLGSSTGQKGEKEAEINTPSCSHRQAFCSLLYNHPSALAPYTLPNFRPAAVPDHKWLLIFPSPCTSILFSDVLHNHFFPPSFSFTSDFSPVHSAGPATFLHTRQSDAEAGGKSWECPCISSFSPV